MFKYLLFLAFLINFNFPAFAVYTYEGFKSEDPDLERVAKGIVLVRGQTAPSGWEIDPQKTVWTYSVVDNVDGHGDCTYCIKNGKMFTGRYQLASEPRDTDPNIQAQIESNFFKEEDSKISVKRDINNNIKCTMESKKLEDLGGGSVHYYYSKQVTLKEKVILNHKSKTHGF